MCRKTLSCQKQRIAALTASEIKGNPFLRQQVCILGQYLGWHRSGWGRFSMLSVPLVPGCLINHSRMFYLRQKAGVSTTSKVKISRRPSSMPRHSTHLLKPLTLV